MNTKELKEKRGVLDTELKALAKKVDDKSLTETEEKRFDEVIAEIEGLNSQIETAEKREIAIADAEKRSVAVPFAINPVKTDNEKQVVKEFRFTKLLSDLANQRKLEGFYAEMHAEGVRNMSEAGIKGDENGYIVPPFIVGNEKRDMAAVTNDTAKAGYTIQTDLLAQQWIDNLKNALIVPSMGAKFMTGLQGNIAIPKKTTNSGATWLTETGAITAADHVWDSIEMSPKRLGNATAFSRKLLAQSSLDIEMIVREDLVTSQALALQDAIIHGAIGGNNPVGILNTSGIGSVAIDTNGGALTFAKAIALETGIATSNALQGTLQYLTNSKVWGASKSIEKATNTAQFILENGLLNGYPVKVTNAVPSTLSKGSSGAVCSALIFGNWADLMIGQWGGLIITVNPYSLDTSAQVRVVMNAFYDVKLRRAESFSAIKDITTA